MASQGTRGLSAGDWIRLKRLNSSVGYGMISGAVSKNNAIGNANSAVFLLNKDISPPEASQIPRSTPMLIPYEAAGKPKILRPASNWTDYVASQTGDFFTAGTTSATNPAMIQTRIKICDGSTDSNFYANKPALPAVNAFNRLKIVS